jgi:hypothetical protein
MSTNITLDRDTLDSLADKLERTAVNFSEPERTHLVALLAAGSSEVAGRAGMAPPESEVGDLLSGGVHAALRPLAGIGPAAEVEPYDGSSTAACGEGHFFFGSITICGAMTTSSSGTATATQGSSSAGGSHASGSSGSSSSSPGPH